LVGSHDRERDLLEFFGHQALAVLQRNEGAVHAEHRRKTGLQVDVRGTALQGDLENLVQVQAHLSPSIDAGTQAFLRPDSALP